MITIIIEGQETHNAGTLAMDKTQLMTKLTDSQFIIKEMRTSK